LWPDAVDNLASAVRAGLSLPEALTQLGQRCLNSFDTPKLVCRLVAQPARHSRSEQTSPGPSRRRLHLGRLPDGMRQRAEPQQIPSVIAAGGQAGPGRSDGSSSEPGPVPDAGKKDERHPGSPCVGSTCGLDLRRLGFLAGFGDVYDFHGACLDVVLGRDADVRQQPGQPGW
jgi:hypothetical protein